MGHLPAPSRASQAGLWACGRRARPLPWLPAPQTPMGGLVRLPRPPPPGRQAPSPPGGVLVTRENSACSSPRRPSGAPESSRKGLPALVPSRATSGPRGPPQRPPCLLFLPPTPTFGQRPAGHSTFNPQLTSRPPWARAFHCAETEESLRHRGEGGRVCEAPPAARQKSPKQKTFLPSERSAREPTSGFNLQALGLSYHVGALLGGDGPGGARAHGAHRAKPRITLGEGPRWVRVPADGGEGAEQPASRPSLGNPFPLWGLETLESPCASREQTRSAPAPRSLSRDAGIPRPTAAHRGPCHLPDHAPDS